MAKVEGILGYKYIVFDYYLGPIQIVDGSFNWTHMVPILEKPQINRRNNVLNIMFG